MIDIKHDTVIRIERLADDGRGIASVQGKTLFVQGALVDEEVTVAIKKRMPTYIDARVHHIIKPSPLRQTPPCPVFSRCGGCSVQYMSAEEQVAFKQDAVLSQLSRWSQITPDTLLPVLTDTEYGYRQRVRLAVDYTKTGELLLGFREVDSHAIVNIDSCMVLSPSLQKLILPLRQWLSHIKAHVVSHVELVSATRSTAFASDSGSEIVGTETVDSEIVDNGTVGIVVRHTRLLAGADRLQLQQYMSAFKKTGLTVNLWFQSQKKGVLEDSNNIEVDPRLEYVLPLASPLLFRFHPQDFIQSNPFINQQMVEQAIALLAPQSHEIVMDLYCGIGNFSLPLALHAKHVLAVEGVEAMTTRAVDNAHRNGIDNVTFITQDLSQPKLLRASVSAYCQKQDAFQSAAQSITSTAQVDSSTKKTAKQGVIDALLLDPPRAGAKTICENIAELLPQRIVYVSCDSSTFARDAGLLVDNGYRLSTLGIMDMFPQTSHVEIMASFIVDSATADPSLKRRKASSRSSQSVTKPKRVLKLG